MGRYPSIFRGKTLSRCCRTSFRNSRQGIFVIGISNGISAALLLASSVLTAFLLISLLSLWKLQNEKLLSLTFVTSYVLLITSLSGTVSDRRSSRTIIQCITDSVGEAGPNIGVINSHDYSLYFYGRAGKNVFGRPVNISFLEATNLPEIMPADFITQSGDMKQIPPNILAAFHPIVSRERWTWMSSLPRENLPTSCSR